MAMNFGETCPSEAVNRLQQSITMATKSKKTAAKKPAAKKSAKKKKK